MIVVEVSHEGQEVPKNESDCFLCLQLEKKVSGKPGWKVNGTQLFGSIQWKISWRNGTSEKVVLFFRMECFKRKFVFHFFKAMLPVLCLRRLQW